MLDLTKNKNAIIYARLSRDDFEHEMASSIINQIDGLTSYANKHGFKLVDVCSDEGYSGSNFDRPGFKRMMEHIDAGNANVIIVKDLSRFGRNFLRVSEYIDGYYKDNNIRFISVNENYDSATDTEEFSIVIRNFLNGLYLKEFRRKSLESIERKSRKESLTSTGFYGLNKIDGKFVPDPVTSPIIKKIFISYLNGMSLKMICDMLDSEGIVTPGDYREEMDVCGYKNPKKTAKQKWNTTTVLRILHKREYIGDTVNNKGNHKEPIIIPNTHEAIIDRELFFKVQSMVKMTPIIDQTLKDDALIDLVHTSNAGKVCFNKMRFYENRKEHICVSIEHVKNILYKESRKMLKDALQNRDQFAKEMLVKIKKANGSNKLEQLEKELSSLEETYATIFEDYAEDRISKETYNSKIQNLNSKRNELVKIIAKIKEEDSDYMLLKKINKFIDSLLKLKGSRDKNKLIRCCVKDCLISKTNSGQYSIQIIFKTIS